MGPLAQIEDFVLTLLLGIVAGFLFDYYQASLRGFRIKRYPQYILDMTVWIIMIALVGMALLIINQAEIRVYVFIALLAGAVIYFRLFAHYIRRPIDAMGQATAGILKTTFKAFIKPGRTLLAWIKEKRQQDIQPDEEPIE